MGRHAGYRPRGAVSLMAPRIIASERYDGNEQMLINRIIDNRKRGKRHHIIINAEGIDIPRRWRSESRKGNRHHETRATILGYMQRGSADL